MTYEVISQVHRLCVYASGSLMTVICNSFALIKVSRLHFGQNKGKFFNSVSVRSFIRVLLLQKGHNNHFSTFIACFLSNTSIPYKDLLELYYFIKILSWAFRRMFRRISQRYCGNYFSFITEIIF